MNSTNSLLVRAIELQNQGLLAEAEALFLEQLALEPHNPVAIYSLGVIYLNRSDLVKAGDIVERGVKAVTNFAPLWFVRAAIFQAAGEMEAALGCFDRALEVNPDYAEVLINSGALLRDMHRHHEALQRFQKALEINPQSENALGNCGILLTEFKRSAEAIEMFRRLLEINPTYSYGLGLLCYERMHACDWTDLELLSERIRKGIHEGRKVCKTLALMAISDVASEHFLAARIFARNHYPDPGVVLWKGESYQHERIRIAYVSPDLREHPVGHLMAGIFERHDKSQFETIAISLGIDDGSRLRDRMQKAFDRFIDVKGMSSRKIAELMRAMEIDVAIDLAGYTSDSRTDVFAYRPAPVQVTYLGYPGTLGSDYFDYILADRHIIPPDHAPFYSEKIEYLPDTYLPTDASIKISDRTPSRAECGLPDSGAVFCSFSHDYKINPTVFAVWMRLLQQTPGSVLWLVTRNELSHANLRASAQQQSIDPQRLIFASRVPLVEDHLARYRLADVFLDTWPYNAHTTAADALMSGLPVVTYMGGAFPARVAGSLLHAIGLPELVASSFAEYEALALRMATDRVWQAEIRSKLAKNKTTHALFDTERFCRNLETSYRAMLSRKLAVYGLADDGLLPQERVQSPVSYIANDSRQKVSMEEINRAIELNQTGDLTNAAEAARKILERDPRNSVVLHLLGLVEFRTKNYPEAIKRIRASVALDPNQPDAYVNLGCAFAAAGDREAAIQSFAAALRLRPDFDDAQRNLDILQGK